MELASIAAFQLVPVLPSFFYKYGASLERDPPIQTKTTIPAITRFTSFPDEVPLPEDWVEHVHPEGSTYFQNPNIRVVSNTDPRRTGVNVILNNAAERIRSQLPRDQKPDGPEVYLNVSDASRLGPECIVEYYLVDYKSRSIFWVENIDILTNLGGIGSSVEPFESTRHLRSALQPEFWVHVEYYPCHQPTYDHEAEKKLTAVLQHGCVDDMTAPGSVFPYGADECVRYLKLLERVHGDDKSMESFHRSWTARLWASICRSRHINRYGLPYPRVDRLQGLDSYLQQQTRKSVAMALGETFCLGMSKRTFAQLTELWNGRIVYQRHWQPFLERQRLEWKWTTLGGLYLLMMNVVQRLCGASIIPVVSSASFTCSSILVSALMIHTHSVERLKTASDISSYIYMAESFSHGLRPLSIAFTLPKALLGYGVLISAGSTLHHLTSQFQDNPTELLHLSALAFLPLLMSVAMYRAYGPSPL